MNGNRKFSGEGEKAQGVIYFWALRYRDTAGGDLDMVLKTELT